MKNILTSGLICLAMLAACSHTDKKEEEANTEKAIIIGKDEVQLSAEQVKNAGILIGKPESKGMHSTINVNGVVDVPPENIYSVSVPMGGYIKQMMLIPGMSVKKGSVLATAEDQQYIQLQQDYLTAKNKLRFAFDDYNRQKGLNLTKATSDKIFQQTESEYNNEKVMVNALAEKLRLIGINPNSLNENNISRTIKVYAPVSGYVTKVNVNRGKYVNAADILFEIISPGALHVALTVFEGDAINLKVGQKIICTTTANPDKKYVARVDLIKRSIEDDRTTSVHCDLENGADLLPGTFLNAAIAIAPKDADAVPDEAVVKWENKYYVFSPAGADRYKIVAVEIGTSLAGFTEIRASQKIDEVVVKNAYAILMKMKNSAEGE
ncbi:MAG: efflux RND transporter periplasmic adaptor subunit [Pedobacter sp.]|uniref:efflux RND transporter periplasmic adaptor subunit n=1 Tax=Pedobacter sp. TaxID=1411316 RepID=UPI0033952815